MTTTPIVECLLRASADHHDLADYQSGLTPRWCVGCGDNAILAAVQRLCRDEQLDPARTVFVSGIGCSSRLPHYMGTYGFHGTHGRALPIAEGVKMSRPDLAVFVSTGDGDTVSIGAAHWIHALRYNMDLTVLLHDNRIYGLTKKQASPTSPLGTKSNTTPSGSVLAPIDPLSVSLGVANVSFVAQAVDWIPETLYSIVAAAYRHKGFSLVRIVQRCPEYMPGALDAFVQDPQRTLILTHPNGISVGPALATVYRNRREHDPSDLAAARALTGDTDTIPVGILYRNDEIPRYEVLRGAGALRTMDELRRGLDAELDRFTVSTETGPER